MAIEKGPTGRIKGLRKLLAPMTRQDVLEVLERFSLAQAADYGFADSTDFDLIFQGRAYPPKAVLGLAAARVVGRPLTSDEFSGGDQSPCFMVLQALKFEVVRKATQPFSQMPLRHLHRGEQYERADIAGIFEPGTKFTPGAGRWGISGIVETPPESSNFVFMVTLGEPVEGNPYQDSLTLDGHLVWESQSRHDFKSAVIRKLLVHDSSKNNIHFFVRGKEGAKYTYMGLLDYCSHDPEKTNPVHFNWTIQRWDFSKEQLEGWGLPVLAPQDPAYSVQPTRLVPQVLKRVMPPQPSEAREMSSQAGRQRRRQSKVVDWAARDLRNRQLGLRGEQLVLRYEQEALKAAGRPDLAAQVQHVALVNCAAGYDIASFHMDGTPKRIEVKATQGPAETPFYISINEVLTSREDPASFSIYRVFDLEHDAEQVKFYELRGDVELSCSLQAVSFRAFPGADTEAN